MCIGSVLVVLEAAIRRIGFCHGLANQRGIGQDLCLPRVGPEGLALFQAEGPQHRMKENVAGLDRFDLDHFIDPLPIFHPAWWQPTPCFRARIQNVHLRRIVALGVGIHLQVR